MIKILKYSFFDLVRSKWSYIYFFFYLITAFCLLYLIDDLSKAITNLMNMVVILCPLVGILFGTMYYYNSRDFIELLLAQPVRRSSIFLGQYLGVSISLSLSLILGLGIPFLFYGIHISGHIWNFSVLLITGLLLTFIFTAISFLITLRNESKIKGFGKIILVWLVMAVIYDGILLIMLTLFQDYPIENFAMAATLLNPIDLSRILIVLKLDISALMGYTGTVFKQFFGASLGLSISFVVLLFWVIVPVFSFMNYSKNKDF